MTHLELSLDAVPMLAWIEGQRHYPSVQFYGICMNVEYWDTMIVHG
jgi:hypothetical protein